MSLSLATSHACICWPCWHENTITNTSSCNFVGLGSGLHLVINELMDFKFDLLKESYKADHGLSILRGEQGIWLLNQIFSKDCCIIDTPCSTQSL